MKIVYDIYYRGYEHQPPASEGHASGDDALHAIEEVELVRLEDEERHLSAEEQRKRAREHTLNFHYVYVIKQRKVG